VPTPPNRPTMCCSMFEPRIGGLDGIGPKRRLAQPKLPGQVLQLPIFPLGHDRPHGAASIGSATVRYLAAQRPFAMPQGNRTVRGVAQEYAPLRMRIHRENMQSGVVPRDVSSVHGASYAQLPMSRFPQLGNTYKMSTLQAQLAAAEQAQEGVMVHLGKKMHRMSRITRHGPLPGADPNGVQRKIELSVVTVEAHQVGLMGRNRKKEKQKTLLWH